MAASWSPSSSMWLWCSSTSGAFPPLPGTRVNNATKTAAGLAIVHRRERSRAVMQTRFGAPGGPGTMAASVSARGGPYSGCANPVDDPPDSVGAPRSRGGGKLRRCGFRAGGCRPDAERSLQRPDPDRFSGTSSDKPFRICSTRRAGEVVRGLARERLAERPGGWIERNPGSQRHGRHRQPEVFLGRRGLPVRGFDTHRGQHHMVVRRPGARRKWVVRGQSGRLRSPNFAGPTHD
jgi:hypothetical protein